MPRKNASQNFSRGDVVALTTVGEWMTVEEVCALIPQRKGEPLARSTLDGWRVRDENPFPAPKRLPNRNLLYRRAEVAAWLDGLPEAA